MDEAKIARITDPADLRTLMANAKRQSREDIYWLAFRRLCTLEQRNFNDPLEYEFQAVLRAYEELLTEKNGRTTKANYARRALKNKGVEQCLTDWALGPRTTGFDLLVSKGLAEFTAEHVVVKHANRFPALVVEAAQKRLAEATGTKP